MNSKVAALLLLHMMVEGRVDLGRWDEPSAARTKHPFDEDFAFIENPDSCQVLPVAKK